MRAKGVTISLFPTVAGVSKLRAMVRLSDPRIKQAFLRKRADVRYAIIKRGFRRNLVSANLPNIASAPDTNTHANTPQNGAFVIDVETPADVNCSSNSLKTFELNNSFFKALLLNGPVERISNLIDTQLSREPFPEASSVDQFF